MRIGYVLGRQSPFSFSDARSFTEAFATDNIDARGPAPIRHIQWLQPASERKASSDEQFVEHFREQYDDRVPIWALTELLELGNSRFNTAACTNRTRRKSLKGRYLLRPGVP